MDRMGNGACGCNCPGSSNLSGLHVGTWTNEIGEGTTHLEKFNVAAVGSDPYRCDVVHGALDSTGVLDGGVRSCLVDCVNRHQSVNGDDTTSSRG